MRNPFQQAIFDKRFSDALTMLEDGDNPLEGLQPYHISGIFDQLCAASEFDMMASLVDHEYVSLDVYDYDRFDSTVFMSLVNRLPDTDEAMEFLESFLQDGDSLDDEIGGKTLVGLALEKSRKPAFVKALANAGCSLEYVDKSGYNYMHKVIKTFAIKPPAGKDYIDLFIEEGLDPEAKNVVGETALHMAVKAGKRDYIETLVNHGADLNAKDDKGNTAFYYVVAELRDFEAYQIMIEHDTPDFSDTNKEGVTMIYEFVRMISSASNQELQFLNKLIEDGADMLQPGLYYGKEKTPLDFVLEKDPEVLKTVLEATDIDLNEQDNQGDTLLHKACRLEMLHEDRRAKALYKKVKLLIKEGADPNIANDQDQKPIDLASQDDIKAKTVELLLKHQ